MPLGEQPSDQYTATLSTEHITTENTTEAVVGSRNEAAEAGSSTTLQNEDIARSVLAHASRNALGRLRAVCSVWRGG